MTQTLENLRVIKPSELCSADVLSLELGESLRILPGRREVCFAKLSDPSMNVVVKRYFPHAKQARDWEREWEGLEGLQKRNLPSPRPVAVCQDQEGNVFVIMQCIDGADTLGRFLEAADAANLLVVLAKLAQLAQRVHDTGARQTDQHVDNWAVANDQVYLLDAGTYEFTPAPLPRQSRLTDLAAICVTLPPVAEEPFRCFLRENYQAERGQPWNESLDAELNSSASTMQQARARRYFKKTQRMCTEFEPRKNTAWSGMVARSANANLLECFVDNPDALMAEGVRLKSGNTCTVQSFEFAGKRYVLKRYNQRPWFTQLRRSIFPSRASKSWSNGWVLDLAFILSAKPIAFVDECSFPRQRGYLLMEQIDADLLPDYVARHRKDAARVGRLIAEVGRIWTLLERIRATHGDLKATNWMVSAEGTVYLFDLDSFRFGLSDAAFRKGQKKDRERFLKNWELDPELVQAFGQRMETRPRA